MQVAVITGASSGIGWALAKALAAAGYQVGLVARRVDRLTALAEEIRQAGGMAAVAVADVGSRDQVLAAMTSLRAALGPIDLLVANAGMGMPTRIEPVNATEIEAIFRVNVLGVVYALEAVLPEMLQRRQGHIAGISSMAAYKGFPGKSAYCASKAALNNYLEGLRVQLREQGVLVTTICPGFVATPMTEKNPFPMPWLLSPEEAARRIVRALRRKRKVYNFPWQMRVFMEVLRWAPDWVLARGMHRYGEDAPPP